MLFMAGLISAGILFYSCSTDSVEPLRITPESGGMEWLTPQLKDYFMDRAETKNAELANQNNGASFIEPFFISEGFGVFDFQNAVIASFDAPYDDNDWWRENPDGTVSLHLSSREAVGGYFEFITGTEYIGNPDGHLNLNYTGDLIQDTIYLEPDTIYTPVDTIFLPADTVYLNFLSINPSYNAVMMQGRGEVFNVLDPDDTKTLRVRVVDNPNHLVQATYSLD